MSGEPAAAGGGADPARWYAYIDQDIGRVFYNRFPATPMNQERASLHHLRRQARLLEVWGEYLPHYRSVRCEPLEPIYQWLMWLGAIDQPLWDQFFHGSWHGQVYCAWMTIMRPTPAHRDRLEQVARSRPHAFAAGLAVHVLDGTAPPNLAEHIELIDTIRRHLYSVPWPMLILRRPDMDAMREVHAAVSAIYKEQGAGAAHAYLRTMARTSSLPLIEHTAPTRLAEAGAPPREPWYWGMSI